MKGILAVAVVVLLCLSLFAGSVLWRYSQRSFASDGSTDPVAQLWSFKPAASQVSAPVISGGYVYFATNSGLGNEPVDASPGSFYCLKASTGAVVWNEADFSSDFVIENGYIYASSGADVFCVDASDGALLWNFSHAVGFGDPVVVAGTLYVGCINSTSTPSDVGVVFALNASTGAEIWNFSGSLGSRFDLNPVVVADDNVYAVSSMWTTSTEGYTTGYCSGIYALQASSGKELWNCTTQGWYTGLTVGDNNVYVSCDYGNPVSLYSNGILAFGAQNGRPLWNYTSLGQLASFTFASNTVYLVSSEGVLNALNASDGSVNWSYTAGTGLGSLLSVNSYLYVGSSYGVYCFNMSNGAIVWNFATSDFSDSSTTNPAYSNGVVYVGWNGPTSFAPTTQHNLYALNAFDGKVLWNYTLGYAEPSLTFSNGIVFIGADFVTTESPDFEGPGVVLALQPEETLPLLTVATVTIIVVILIATVILWKRKRMKTKETNPPLQSTSVFQKYARERRGINDGFA